MREICTSGSMRGVWKRSHGTDSKAPPIERGGQQICRTYSHRATSRLYRTRPLAPSSSLQTNLRAGADSGFKALKKRDTQDSEFSYAGCRRFPADKAFDGRHSGDMTYARSLLSILKPLESFTASQDACGGRGCAESIPTTASPTSIDAIWWDSGCPGCCCRMLLQWLAVQPALPCLC